MSQQDKAQLAAVPRWTFKLNNMQNDGMPFGQGMYERMISRGRMKKEKPYNSGTWTTARMRSFIMSALRRAMWPVKYRAIQDSYVKDGINPKTGRKCRLHRCSECGDLYPQNQMQADHIEPVVPLDGFENKVWLEYDWNELLQRLYCEADGLQAVCKPCHKAKSAEERKARNDYRRKTI